MTSALRHILLLFAALLAPAAAVVASQTEANAPVEVSMHPFLNYKATPGFIPVSITQRNRTDKTQHHVLHYKIHTHEYRKGHPFKKTKRVGAGMTTGSFALSVEARGVNRTHVFVPANTISQSRGYATLSLQLEGPGCENGFNHREITFPSNGVSTGMGTRSYAAYSSYLSKAFDIKSRSVYPSYAPDYTFSSIHPASLLPDWRTYTALGTLVFDSTEWDEIPADNRTAILEWTAMGGNLCLVARSDTWLKNLRFPDAIETREQNNYLRLGSGGITLLPPGGNEKEIAQKIEKAVYGTHCGDISDADFEPEDAQKWKPRANKEIITLFLVLFALVIGSLNFLFLTSARSRSRILWTTLLVVFTAGLFLMGSALFDGFGGRGERLVVAHFLPEQNRLVVKQMQISRTGLLLNSSFDLDENTRLTAIYGGEFAEKSDSRSHEYTRTSTGWSGDWFSSHAIQSQFAQTLRPARGAVRVTLPDESGKNGAVLSTLETPLAEIYVIPDGKTFYKAAHLVPGVKCPLTPASSAEFDRWWEEQTKFSFFGGVFRMTPAYGQYPSKKFYARAAKANQVAVATLKSIIWERDIALIHGAAEFVTETAAPPVPANEPPAANAPATQVAKVLDFAERYRNLPFIGVLKPECQNPARWE
jgi:hypothetical protein